MTTSSSRSDPFKDMADRQAKAVRSFQEAAAESLRAWQSLATGGAGAVTPASMPDAKEAVETYFRFAEQMLAQQRDFTLGVLGMMDSTRATSDETADTAPGETPKAEAKGGAST